MRNSYFYFLVFFCMACVHSRQGFQADSPVPVVAKIVDADSTTAESIGDYTVAAAGTNTNEALVVYGESEPQAPLRYTKPYTVADQLTVNTEPLNATAKQQRGASLLQKPVIKHKKRGSREEEPPINSLALVSFGLGMASIVFFFALLGIGSIITGFIALRQIKRQSERGRGFAIAGIFMGVLAILLSILLIALFIAAFTI